MQLDAYTLKARVDGAQDAYRHCELCSRRCGVDRTKGPAGFCNLGEEAHIYRELLHYGEERPLSPSHTIYMTGCNFRCVFCSEDHYVRNPSEGAVWTAERLAKRITQRTREGARNVNFVGGSPDVNLLAILRALELCHPSTHVVWNSNLYNSPALFDLLNGVVDTWLVDVKFGTGRCGRLAGVRDAWSVVVEGLQRIEECKGALLVRHLAMPGHGECCTRWVLDWLAARHPDAAVNLMTGYVPFAAARNLAPLDRRPSAEARHAARQLALDSAVRRLLLDGEVARWEGPWPPGWLPIEERYWVCK